MGQKGSRRSDREGTWYMEWIRQDRSAVLGVGLLLYPRGGFMVVWFCNLFEEPWF